MEAKVAIVMGSKSDWETMAHADEILTRFKVAHDSQIVSAHRTPELMRNFALEAESNYYRVIIAGAGGAAHLPGMISAQTTIPVLGVPIESHALKGLDSLFSIVQMPAGVPTATFAIGKAGAINAALFAISILANEDPRLRIELKKFRQEQEERVLAEKLN